MIARQFYKSCKNCRLRQESMPRVLGVLFTGIEKAGDGYDAGK